MWTDFLCMSEVALLVYSYTSASRFYLLPLFHKNLLLPPALLTFSMTANLEPFLCH